MRITHLLRLAIYSLALGAATLRADTCLFNHAPGTRFDGVDSQGYVFLHEQLGTLQIEKNLGLRIFATFESGRDEVSPLSGWGWRIALLESTIEPHGKLALKVTQTNGIFRAFYRNNETDNVYTQRNWTVEVNGADAVMKTDCGDLAEYQDGRLAALTVQGHRLEYIYENGAVVQIREGDKVHLQVERDPDSGETTGLLLANGDHIQIQFGDRPRIDPNQPELTGMGRTITSFTKADGTEAKYEFGLTDLNQPKVTLAGGRELSWDASNRRALSDGDWDYFIIPGKGVIANAEIEKLNRVTKKKEYWFKDTAKGIEITESPDGIRTEVQTYTDGPLRNRIKSMTRTRNGEILSQTEYKYDENGNRINTPSPRSSTGSSASSGSSGSSSDPGGSRSSSLSPTAAEISRQVKKRITPRREIEAYIANMSGLRSPERDRKLVAYVNELISNGDFDGSTLAAGRIRDADKRFEAQLKCITDAVGISKIELDAAYANLARVYPDRKADIGKASGETY